MPKGRGIRAKCPMTGKEIRNAINHEVRHRRMAIRRQNRSDILVDDFVDDKHINFHLKMPSIPWITRSIMWPASLRDRPEADAWSNYLASYLKHIDHNMLICLNKIIILDTEQDFETCQDELELQIPDIELPDMTDFAGKLWFLYNSPIINLGCIRENVDDTQELKTEFLKTLLHEVRHLGLNCNPFLPEKHYPAAVKTEQSVETWAQNTYYKITPLVSPPMPKGMGLKKP